MKTARKAGIKTKEASPVKKYGIPTPPPTRRDPSATLPAHMDQRPSSMSLEDDELSGMCQYGKQRMLAPQK